MSGSFQALPNSALNECVGGVGLNCRVTHCSNGTFVSDCVRGVLTVDYLDVVISCECSCTRNWSRMSGYDCQKPRRHKLACRFGGPRWGINCWNNSELIETAFTSFENEVSHNLPARVYISFNPRLNYTYCSCNKSVFCGC